MGEIAQSLLFLADYTLDSDLTFFIPENYSVTPSSVEPIYQNHNDETWGGYALASLGYSSGGLATRCYAFCNDKRREFATNWYYVAFTVRDVCDEDHMFADHKFAFVPYLHAPYLVQTYTNDGWGTSNMDMVFRHESSHIFGADDEYAASDCDQHCNDPFGYLHVRNENCVGCPPPPAHVDCIMSESNEQYCDCMCPYTMGQLGWQDSNADLVYDPINRPSGSRKAPLGRSGYTFAPGDWIYIKNSGGQWVKTVALSDWNCPPPFGRFPWDGVDYKGDQSAIEQYYYRRNNQGEFQAINLGADNTSPEICDFTVTLASEYPGPHVLNYRFRDPNVGIGIARARVVSTDVASEPIPVLMDKYNNGSCNDPITTQNFYLPSSGGYDLNFMCYDGDGHSAVAQPLHFNVNPISSAPGEVLYVPEVKFGTGFPNPTRDTVSWSIQSDLKGEADVMVVSADGRVVREWDRRQLPAGKATFVWDGQDQAGHQVAAGKYFLMARTKAGTTSLGNAVIVR